MAKSVSYLAIQLDSSRAKRESDDFTKSLRELQNSGNKASTSVSNVGTQSVAAANGMNTATNAAKTLASQMMAVITIHQAISKMDAYTQINNKLKIVTNSQEQLNIAMSDTFAIAQRSASSWAGVNDVYSKYMANAKDLGLTQAQVARLTETTSKAVALSGSSAESAAAALFQYGQSLDGGILRAEEFNSLVDGAGGLLNAMAKGLNVNRGQLRQMMLDGKLTMDVVIKSLLTAGSSVDELFSKTDITTKQSMDLLSDSVVKFIGEAGQGSGASKVLSESIRALAGNIEFAANAAMIGGAYWLGTYIPAIYKSVAASAGKVQAITSEIAAQYALINSQKAAATQEVAMATAQIRNIETTLAALAAERQLELQRLKSQISAQGLAAAQTRLAEISVIGAQSKAELIAMTNAQAVAQERLNLVQKTSITAGSGLLGILGGPVGLGLTVAGVAASMLMMSSNTNAANEELKNQSKYAGMAADELARLDGNKKKFAGDELSKELELQNNLLKAAQKEFEALTESIANNNKGNVEAERIWAQVKAGVMTTDQAVAAYNKANFITSGQMTQLENSQKNIKDLEVKVDDANTKLHQVKPASDTAASGITNVGNAASNAATQVTGFTNAYNDYIKKLQNSATKNKWIANYAEQNNLKDYEAEAVYNAAVANGGKANQQMVDKTLSLVREGKAVDDLNDKRQKAAQAQAKADRERENQLKKQNKLLAEGNRLVGISGNTGRSFGPHLHVQYPKGSGLGGVTAEHMARFKLGGKTLNPNMSKHPYGEDRGSRGKHGGWDFSAPQGTPITTDVAVKSVTTHKGDTAGFYSRVTFEDGVVIDLMHQVPGIDKKLKAGSSSGKSNSLTYKQQQNAEIKDAREKESLQADYYTIAQKDAADHEKKIADLNKHGLQNQVAQENERYEYVKQLRSMEYTQAVDGWKWVGEEKIKNEAFISKLQTQISSDLNKDQKAEKIKSIDEQRDYEIAAIQQTQREKQADYEQELAQRRRDIDDKMARNKMGSGEYQVYALAQSKNNAYIDNDDQRDKEITQLNKLYAEKEILQDEHLKRLEAAKQLHADNEYAISLEYSKKEDDLLRSQRDAQVSMWTNILSQGQNTWAQLTQSIKDGAGEQSTAYKIAFAAQQAFSIASTLVSTHVAAAQVMADPSALTLAQKTSYASMITSLGYANAGLIAAQAIAGFSSGGYTGDGGKYDPAGIVHKGEVVWSQDDIARWGGAKNVDAMRQSSPQSSPMIERQRLAAIGEAKASQASVVSAPITVQVNVESSGQSSVDSQGQYKQLGDMIGNAVRSVIMKEQRQGGLLYGK